MAILYVDPSHPSALDSTTKANNSASLPWETIGRALWGNALRSSPSSVQAAAAGDTVIVADGTYTYAGVIDDRFEPVYNPVNAGPLTIQANGQVRLAAPSALSPVAGSNGQDDIYWFADHLTGRNFLIRSYGAITGSAGATEVRTTPDTGPCVVSGAEGCRFEGFRIDGGADPDLGGDNYSAFRLNGAIGAVIRNSYIESFLATDEKSNALTTYGSRDSIFEHCHVVNCGGGVIFKDTATTTLQSGNHIRYNRFDALIDTAFLWSHVTTNTTGGGENRNQVYQNIVNGATWGVQIIGTVNEGALNDWAYNNVIANCTQVGLGAAPGSNTVGIRLWNNIVLNTIGTGARAVYVNGVPMPVASIIHWNRNVYWNFTGFMEDSVATRTFVQHQSVHGDQDQESINQDPDFVDPDNGDFHLQGSSPALNLGRHPDTGATMHAGPYQTDDEQIGLETSAAQAGVLVLGAARAGGWL